MPNTNVTKRAIAGVAVFLLANQAAAEARVVDSDSAFTLGFAAQPEITRVLSRLPVAGVVHGFTAEASGPNGDWEIVVMTAATPAQVLVRLTAARPTLELPRPLGYLLRSEDDIFVVARLRGDRARSVDFRVILRYEPAREAGTRIPVLPFSAQALAQNAAEGSVAHMWEWTAEATGRVLALGGAGLERADELRLEEATTGEVLWRTASESGIGYRPHSAFVRLGVLLQEKRTYRLVAVYRAGAAAEPGPVMAMMLALRQSTP